MKKLKIRKRFFIVLGIVLFIWIIFVTLVLYNLYKKVIDIGIFLSYLVFIKV